LLAICSLIVSMISIGTSAGLSDIVGTVAYCNGIALVVLGLWMNLRLPTLQGLRRRSRCHYEGETWPGAWS